MESIMSAIEKRVGEVRNDNVNAATAQPLSTDYREKANTADDAGTMETIMNMPPMTLEQRIDFAIQPDAALTSVDIAALVEEAEAAIAKAEEEHSIDLRLSLDPKAAREAIADATFAANRLRSLLTKLQARHRQVREQEQLTVWLTEYDTLKRERDALAEELREVYPDAAAKIMDMFSRLAANDEKLSNLHLARLPGVTRHLLSAELHARRLDSFSRDMPSLATLVQLFDWNSGRQIWPPRPPSPASAFAPVVPSGRCYTADWAKDDGQRAAALQRERQRIADFYARSTREQEERENAEVRERFAESQRRISR
jgi:hypothetical protein